MKEYAYYSGLVTQFIVTILLFVGVGYYLDKKYSPNKPLYVVILSLIGIAVSTYTIIKQILKKQK